MYVGIFITSILLYTPSQILLNGEIFNAFIRHLSNDFTLHRRDNKLYELQDLDSRL